MNSTVNTSNSSEDMGGQSLGGFGFGIGVSMGVLLLIIIMTFASYFCSRMQLSDDPSHRSSIGTTNQDLSISIELGIDEATLLSFPMLPYSQAKLHKGDSVTSCCSICLADYKETDMLRLLPDCGHLFHLKCVDPWLRLHPSCPICRNSPVPTPLATPLAEVLPLATRRD